MYYVYQLIHPQSQGHLQTGRPQIKDTIYIILYYIDNI